MKHTCTIIKCSISSQSVILHFGFEPTNNFVLGNTVCDDPIPSLVNHMFVVCPAEGQERSRRSAGNTKKRKTCSQQKGTRIKRFWSKHFRQRNKTIFTEYDRKKSRLSSVNIILFLCLKAFTSQACYVPAFLLESLCALGRRVLVPALLPGTWRCEA